MIKHFCLPYHGFVFIVIMSIFITACKRELIDNLPPTVTVSEIKTATATKAFTLTVTMLPTITATHTPTITFTPTKSSTPTVQPSPTMTPLPQSALVIDVVNASQVVELASWGRGRLYSSELAAGGQVVVASTSMGIYIYQASSMEVIRHLDQAEGPKGSGGFIFSPDRNALLVNYKDGTSHLIRLVDGNEISLFAAIGKINYYIREWLFTLPKQEYDQYYNKYFFEANRISSAAFAPDGTSIAIGYYSGTIGIWRIDDSQLIFELRHDTVGVSTSLIFSPNGKMLLSGKNGDLAAWDVQKGELLWKLLSAGHFNGQPFSADGTLFASEVIRVGSLDSWVRVFTSKYGDDIGQVTGRVGSQAISPDNKLLVTTSYQEVKVWSLPYLIQQKKINTGLDWPQASFTDDGQYILINNGQQAWRVSDFTQDLGYQSPEPVKGVDIRNDEWGRLGHLNPQGMRVISPDRIITWGSDDQYSMWWWDAFAASYHLINIPERKSTGNVDLSPDGSYFATCTEEGLMIVPLDGSDQLLYSRCRTPGFVAISGDNSLVFRLSGNTIDAIDVKTGEVKYSYLGHTLDITGIKAVDDNFLASASKTSSGGFELFFWQINPRTKLGNWIIPENWSRLSNAAISHDDNLLIANLSNRLRLFRVLDGFQRKIFDFGSDGMAFSPDDQIAVLGNSIWQVDNWTQIGTYGTSLADLVDIAFLDDGKSWITLSQDGIVRQWGLR